MNAQGNRIRVYRERKQMSLTTLASLTGLRLETLSRIEHGKQKLGHRAAFHIAQALEVDQSYLLSA